MTTVNDLIFCKPEDQGLDSKRISKFIERLNERKTNLHSFMIVRNGGNFAWALGDHCKDFLPLAYKEEDIKKYLEVQLQAGNMVTFNVLTDIDGRINPMIVKFFQNLQ